MCPAARWLALISLSLCCAATMPQAQTAPLTATLSGVVVDEFGTALANVQITLLNNATAARRKASTNQQGRFRIGLLPPGTYALRAQRRRFAPVLVQNVVVDAKGNRHLEIRLRTAAEPRPAKPPMGAFRRD